MKICTETLHMRHLLYMVLNISLGGKKGKEKECQRKERTNAGDDSEMRKVWTSVESHEYVLFQ